MRVTQPNPGCPLADIVVLVAGDSSMAAVADALGDVTESAISHGVQLDITVDVFSVGTDAFPGKLPSPTLKRYLTDPPPYGAGVPARQLKEHDPGTPPPDYNYDMENAIIDACAFYCWRTGAMQAVLLFANEWPNGGGEAAGTSLADAVKAAARIGSANPVLISTCLTPPPTGMTLAAAVVKEYKTLAKEGSFTDLSSIGSKELPNGIKKAIQTTMAILAADSISQ